MALTQLFQDSEFRSGLEDGSTKVLIKNVLSEICRTAMCIERHALLEKKRISCQLQQIRLDRRPLYVVEYRMVQNVDNFSIAITPKCLPICDMVFPREIFMNEHPQIYLSFFCVLRRCSRSWYMVKCTFKSIW